MSVHLTSNNNATVQLSYGGNIRVEQMAGRLLLNKNNYCCTAEDISSRCLPFWST